MNFLTKVLQSIAKASGPRGTKVYTHKSLKAIMGAVDFHVYRYRKRTGIKLIGARGGTDEQRQYQDSMIINMPKGYKMYALNIDQFLQKLNTPTQTKNDENGNTVAVTLPGVGAFSLSKIPSEIIADLGLEKTKDGYVANKSGYAGWIELAGLLYPLRKTKYDGIKIHGSASKKMIYREKRDGSLEDSFIKVLGAYIASTVVDTEGTPLIKLDIDPAEYIPQKENTEEGNVSTASGVPHAENELKIPLSIQSLNGLDKELVWRETNGCGGKGTLEIEYIALTARLGEPVLSTDPNFPGDENKSFMQWTYSVGEGAVTIYDWKNETLEKAQTGKSFSIGTNVTQEELNIFLKKYDLDGFYRI